MKDEANGDDYCGSDGSGYITYGARTKDWEPGTRLNALCCTRKGNINKDLTFLLQ